MNKNYSNYRRKKQDEIENRDGEREIILISVRGRGRPGQGALNNIALVQVFFQNCGCERGGGTWRGVIVVDDDWQDTAGCGRPEHHFTSRLLGLFTGEWWCLDDRYEKLFVLPIIIRD